VDKLLTAAPEARRGDNPQVSAEFDEITPLTKSYQLIKK
jgi:hypothetical protein